MGICHELRPFLSDQFVSFPDPQYAWRGSGHETSTESVLLYPACAFESNSAKQWAGVGRGVAKTVTPTAWILALGVGVENHHAAACNGHEDQEGDGSSLHDSGF